MVKDATTSVTVESAVVATDPKTEVKTGPD